MNNWVMNYEGMLINLDKVSSIFIESQTYRYDNETFKVVCDGETFDYTLEKFDTAQEAEDFLDELLERLEK